MSGILPSAVYGIGSRLRHGFTLGTAFAPYRQETDTALECGRTSALARDVEQAAAQSGLSGSVRGRPNRPITLLSRKRVSAEIRSPSRVSTSSPFARTTGAALSGR